MDVSNSTIENVLSANKKQLGKDLEKYKNHVYRVFFFCLKLDASEENKEKYAIASVFHDLGIWTAKTFDYLEPSIKSVEEYLRINEKSGWTEEISLMIDIHHKRSTYEGSHRHTVETFRQADWIDVTKGRYHFNLPKDEIKEVLDQFPNRGFHKFLIVQTLINLFKHPLNPLPMFKK